MITVDSSEHYQTMKRISGGTERDQERALNEALERAKQDF